MPIELDLWAKFAADIPIFQEMSNLYAYLGTFLTCTFIFWEILSSYTVIEDYMAIREIRVCIEMFCIIFKEK